MSDSEAPADTDAPTDTGTDTDGSTDTDASTDTGTGHQAGGEYADPNATITCTTCLAEVKADNIAGHFDWHVDVGHHADDAQRERPEPSADE